MRVSRNAWSFAGFLLCVAGLAMPTIPLKAAVAVTALAWFLAQQLVIKD
ncbi:MAG: hypothetical protein AAGG69_00520 [Pseudomonadota bacterium]